MSQDLDFYIEGPSKVSLFMYDNRTLIVENFNDQPVEIKLVANDSKITKLTNLEESGTINAAVENSRVGRRGTPNKVNKFSMTIKPHSYIAFKY